MSRQDLDPTPMDPGDLEPKHRVFLCHSGAQKKFVAKLDADLRKEDRFPFFDRDRYSLPIGEPFPIHIFEAIACCQVGVVILTDEFFMRSHWPMFELVKMVESERKIMPVFLGISPEDLSKEENVAKWTAKWRDWEKSNKRIVIPDWVGAVKKLRTLTGLQYKHWLQYKHQLQYEPWRQYKHWLQYKHAADAGNDEEIQKELLKEFRQELVQKQYDEEIQKELLKEFRKEVVQEIYDEEIEKELLKDFRMEVVQEICKVVPIFHAWDDSHVQGKSHLSKDILEKIENTPMSRGARVVGLYGMGGIGKTTACKSLCKDLNVQFRGRVCHLEFKNDVSEEERVKEALKLVKEALKRLTGANKKSLEDKNLDECWSQLQDRMKFQKVFLAIDNVSSRSKVCDEALRYLSKVVYCEGSIVMVTARGLDELRYVSIDERYCLPMPELVEDEAKALFLDYAKCSMQEVEHEVLRRCLKRCYFCKGDKSGSHYHPLALRVLGSQLLDKKPSEWKFQFQKEDVFNLEGDPENRVYSVLRSSFADLKVELQLLFIDVALMNVKHQMLFNSVFYFYECESYEENTTTKSCYLANMSIFEELSMVHAIKLDVLKERLDVLRKRSLLQEVGDGLERVGMHDLWREFAVMETNRGEKENRRWVYEVVSGEAEESSLSGGSWENLRRICIMRNPYSYRGLSVKRVNLRLSVKRVNFTSCSKVTVLKLNVLIENQTLDLSPLKQLISLEIVSAVRKVSGIGLLTNLAVLKWLKIDIQSVSAVEEISRLTNLQDLQLTAEWAGYTSTMLMLNLGELVWLRVVIARLKGMVIDICLSSEMTSLRMLDLEGCDMLGSCASVGDVVGLEVLVLKYCERLKELPNVEKLTKLRHLNIQGCFSLEALPGLGSLVALQELRAYYCDRLGELPDMSRLAKLEVLDLEHSGLLRCIPGLGALVALRVFDVDFSLIDDWPDWGNLMKLQVVRIISSSGSSKLRHVLNLAVLEFVSDELHISSLSVGKLTNLSKLTALKNLCLDNCKLETLPDMGKDMCLESLTIRHCGNLKRWDGVTGPPRSWVSRMEVDLHCSWTLPQLVKLEFYASSMIELPDLSHFPRLRTFCIQHQSYTSYHPVSREEFAVHCHAEHLHLKSLIFEYSEITSLPDLRKFLSLKKLEIHARKLSSLTISGPLTALERLELYKCESLKALPDLDVFPKLHTVDLYGCGGDLTAREVEKLEARGFRPGTHVGMWTTKPMHWEESFW